MSAQEDAREEPGVPPSPTKEPAETPAAAAAVAPASRYDRGPGRMLGSAGLLAAGNLLSRVMGFVRDRVLATQVGPGLELDAFLIASKVPAQIYTLLIGGQLSAALVPVLSSYRDRDRAELWRAASVLTSVAALICGLAALVVWGLAEPFAGFLAAGFGPEGSALVAQALRVLAPATVVFGVCGALTGLLFSLERFSAPAFAGVLYNLGMIAVLWLLYDRIGFLAMPIGVVAGAAAQLTLLALASRDARIRPSLDWRHPALRRVLILYAPIGAALLITDVLLPTLDARYSSMAGEAARSWLDLATRLTQFPHGFITVAISLAILPALSAAHARGERATYARTLSRGLRMVLALTLPAAVGLVVLAGPVVGLAFQAGAFGDADRVGVALALSVFLIGLPFAAIDWPLNYAFYARGNTWLPALVGLLSFGVWWAVAYGLVGADLLDLPADRLFLGLALADSTKHVAHACTMYVLVRREAGPDAVAGLGRTSLSAGGAALLMGLAVFALDRALALVLPYGTFDWAVRSAAGAALGLLLYTFLADRFGVAEVRWFVAQLRARLARGGAADV